MKLIDKEKFINYVREYYPEQTSWAISAIENSPVINVVFCKDCKYSCYDNDRLMCNKNAKKAGPSIYYGLVAVNEKNSCVFGEDRQEGK